MYHHFKVIIISFTLLLICNLSVCQVVTISGIVYDKQSGEKLIGAHIYDSISKIGTISNVYGYFSFKTDFSKGKMLIFSHVGYKDENICIENHKDTIVNVFLEAGNELKTINIVHNKNTEAINSEKISIENIKQMPNVLGEADILKSFSLKPGIQAGNEGSGQLYVRGGNSDQNLILLDDVPLYYSGHIGGMISVFNTDAVKNIEVYKSGFPASYGGRLSSVIDIRLKDGDMSKWKTTISPGILSSKISTEGPIKKDKISMIIAARKSMIETYLFPLQKYYLSYDDINIYTFNDLSFKINFKINPKNRLYLSIFSATDKVRYSYTNKNNTNVNIKETTPWGTSLISAKWNYIFSKNVFLNLTGALSKYSFQNDYQATFTNNITGTELKIGNKYLSGIYDKSFNIDLYCSVFKNYSIKIGNQNIHHTNKFIYKSSITSLSDTSTYTDYDTSVMSTVN